MEMYYLKSRYYDSEWGRFINPDSVFDTKATVTGTNMYLYCNNNPVLYRDSNGLSTSYTPTQLMANLLGSIFAIAVIAEIFNSEYQLEFLAYISNLDVDIVTLFEKLVVLIEAFYTDIKDAIQSGISGMAIAAASWPFAAALGPISVPYLLITAAEGFAIGVLEFVLEE